MNNMTWIRNMEMNTNINNLQLLVVDNSDHATITVFYNTETRSTRVGNAIYVMDHSLDDS